MLLGIFIIVQLLLIFLKNGGFIACSWWGIFVPSIVYLIGFLLVVTSDRYKF